jgi:two-component system sensor histidine kinase RegB
MHDTFDGRTFLRLLVWLRYAAVAAQTITVLAADAWLDFRLPVGSLLVVVATMLIVNAATHVWLTTPSVLPATPSALIAPSRRMLSGQLGFDIAALTAMLYFTGGPTNPFVSLYLLPVALGALVLPRGRVALLGAVATIAYTALLFRHVPLPHAHGNADFDLHVTGMWVNFLVSAVLLVGFLVHFIAQVERERARVTRVREGALRDEALLGLGFLAAGTAHELNTPLATMRLLLDQWREGGANGVAPRDLELMSEQIERMSSHVRSLAATAKRVSVDHGAAPEPAESWLRSTVREWHPLRPSL